MAQYASGIHRAHPGTVAFKPAAVFVEYGRMRPPGEVSIPAGGGAPGEPDDERIARGGVIKICPASHPRQPERARLEAMLLAVGHLFEREGRAVGQAADEM